MIWAQASVLMHMGPLHAGEAYAITIFALAPFVVLAVVITVVSRRDRRAVERERSGQTGETPGR